MKKNGYSILEILLVIAILTLLTALVVASVDKTRERSRDVKRKADMKAIGLALQFYYEEENDLPGTAAGFNPESSVGYDINYAFDRAGCGAFGNWNGESDWETDPFDTDSLSSRLVSGYISVLPVDPINEIEDVVSADDRFCYIYDAHLAPNANTIGACLWATLEETNSEGDPMKIGIVFGDPVSQIDDEIMYLSKSDYQVFPFGYNCALDEILGEAPYSSSSSF